MPRDDDKEAKDDDGAPREVLVRVAMISGSAACSGQAAGTTLDTNLTIFLP